MSNILQDVMDVEQIKSLLVFSEESTKTGNNAMSFSEENITYLPTAFKTESMIEKNIFPGLPFNVIY